tara:strand:- start:70 stop:303 length:234 start_codon:yes stop_codon:yes gene_type:complete
MFLRIVRQAKFWRSVVALSTGFALLFVLIKGALEQRNFFVFFTNWRNIFGLFFGAFVYGFFVAYGRFYKHYKSQKLS